MRQTRYYCDRCRREVERPCDLSVMPLPARIVNCRTGRIEQDFHDVELCSICMEDLRRLCEGQFARITVSGQGTQVEARGTGKAEGATV